VSCSCVRNVHEVHFEIMMEYHRKEYHKDLNSSPVLFRVIHATKAASPLTFNVFVCVGFLANRAALKNLRVVATSVGMDMMLAVVSKTTDAIKAMTNLERLHEVAWYFVVRCVRARVSACRHLFVHGELAAIGIVTKYHE
jgi:hypothetical protein